MAEPGAEPVIGFAAIPHRLCRQPGMTSGAYHLLGALMFFFRDRAVCNPSNAELEEATGGILSHDSINRALKALETCGVVAVERPSPRSRGPIRLLLPPEIGGDPTPSTFRKSRKVLTQIAEGHTQIAEGHTQFAYPPTPPNKEGELIKKYPEGGCAARSPDFAEAEAGDIEPFAAPAPETPPAGPTPPPSGWEPDDFARLEAEAERLFPLLEFGTKVRRNAHLYPPAYFLAALKEAARTGKRIRFPYVLAICQRYEEDGGPPSPERSGVGVRPQAPSTPIPAYVEVPNGYKPYPSPKKGPARD